MGANLRLNRALVDHVLAVSGRRTREEAVTEALREYVRRREVPTRHLFSVIEYEETRRPVQAPRLKTPRA